MEIKESDYYSIKKEIRFYARDMNQWWRNLQKDSVAEWVLLTTIGCWGIPNCKHPGFSSMNFLRYPLFQPSAGTLSASGCSGIHEAARCYIPSASAL